MSWFQSLNFETLRELFMNLVVFTEVAMIYQFFRSLNEENLNIKDLFVEEHPLGQ